ncbi:hypothetical protein FFLO_05844 [Filobasidium floriforme]|uniref:Uncharacterized protein n=1 Tax=Filobasidium floriforme TaxID=5210 RepID=A0A8K0NNK6_9TREE|nr:hypothetical protein FFLO_05844 [Filobasidium floriforme]
MSHDSLTPVRKVARRAIEATIGSKDAQANPEVDAPGSAQDYPVVDNANDHHPTVSTPTSANAGPANPPIDLQHVSQASSELPELTESVVSQPSHLIDQDPFNASPAITSVLLHESGRTGSSSMESFVQWLPPARRIIIETETILYWCAVLGYFLTNTLFNGGSIDLNQKLKSTRKLARPLPNKSKDKSTLITSDHNKPDLVLTYKSVGGRFDTWRLCMVIEAKPATKWGTAMAQIIVYMMKALLMDGCTMGLVIAGTEYRFLFWSADPNGVQHLYIVVPEEYTVSGKPIGKSITFKAAVDNLTKSAEEWDLAEGDTSEQFASVSRRNLFRIFSHLERRTAASDGRTGAFDDCPPGLEEAKTVEITGPLWDHMPGSSFPATNGMGVENVDGIDESGADETFESIPEDDGEDYDDQEGTDGAAESEGGFDDIGGTNRAVALSFARFQAMGRVKHQIGSWQAKPDPSDLPGMVSSNTDSSIGSQIPVTPQLNRDQAVFHDPKTYTQADWDFIFPA